jgi:hypothetical protein
LVGFVTGIEWTIVKMYMAWKEKFNVKPLIKLTIKTLFFFNESFDGLRKNKSLKRWGEAKGTHFKKFLVFIVLQLVTN